MKQLLWYVFQIGFFVGFVALSMFAHYLSPEPEFSAAKVLGLSIFVSFVLTAFATGLLSHFIPWLSVRLLKRR